MKYKFRRLFILLAVVLIIVGLAVYFCYDPEEYDGSTIGTITRIEQAIGGKGDSDTFYKVLISYAAGGMEYRDVEYSSYSSDMRVGQSVTVRYKTKDPSQIAAPEVDNVPQYGLTVAIFGLIILYLNSRSIKRAKKKAKLEEAAVMEKEEKVTQEQKEDNSGGMKLL